MGGKVVGRQMKRALAIAFAAGIAAAQSPDWAAVKGIAKDIEVRVSSSDGKSMRGKFQSASDDSLILAASNAEQTVARAQIKRVSTKKKNHRLRNTLIGAGIGGGTGAAIGASTKDDEGFFAIAEEVLAPSGAAFGALIGALIPTGGWRDVYRVK